MGIPHTSAQLYVSGNVGGVFLSEQDVVDTFAGGSGTGTADTNFGWGLAAAVGYDFGSVRAEGEISYRRNALDTVTVNTLTLAGVGTFAALGTFSVDGSASALGFMANAYYDIPLDGPIKPILGAGIGVARLSLDVDTVGGAASTFDASDTVFAYQAIAGAAYEISPMLSAHLTYRFFGTTDPQFSDGTDTVDAEYQNHSVMVGVTKRF